MLNNQPFIYIEEDIKIPVLTPNTLLYEQPIMILEERLDEVTPEVKRPQRYMNKCKEAAWKRWKKEYLRSLRGKHNTMHNTKATKIEVGDVFLMKGEEKNKRKWSIGIGEELYKGNDGVTRGVNLRTPKSNIERPVQHLYPRELHWHMEKSPSTSKSTSQKKLNVDGKEYRPRRTAAAVPEMGTRDIVTDQSDE